MSEIIYTGIRLIIPLYYIAYSYEKYSLVDIFYKAFVYDLKIIFFALCFSFIVLYILSTRAVKSILKRSINAQRTKTNTIDTIANKTNDLKYACSGHSKISFHKTGLINPLS
jgi:hypothetical protein